MFNTMCIGGNRSLDTNLRDPFYEANILVTGGAGFIGSHLIKRLVAYGANVFTIIRESSNLWRLNNCIQDIKIIKLDLRSKYALRSCIEEIMPEYVFHMAAYGVDYRNNDYIEAITTNVIGITNLVEALSGMGCRKIINAGSGMEYGCSEGTIIEQTRLNPNNIYGSSKAAATLIAHQIAKDLDLSIVTLRPFGIYGEFENPSRLFAQIILSALNNIEIKLTGCKQLRDYTYIGNIVDGLLMSAANDELQNEILNIGSGTSYQLKYYIELIFDCLGTKSSPVYGAIPYRQHDLCKSEPDISSIKKLLGWEPAVNLENGIRRTVEWFKNNAQLY